MSIKAESKRYFAALSAHVCQLRKAHSMTQAELARALGVSQQAVFAYELGDRRISVIVLAKIARVFGMSLNELIGIDPPARKGRPRYLGKRAGLQNALVGSPTLRDDPLTVEGGRPKPAPGVHSQNVRAAAYSALKAPCHNGGDWL